MTKTATPNNTMISMQSPMIDRMQDILTKAKIKGADQADVVYVQGTTVSYGQRLGKPEKLERSEGHDLGVRVFVGKSQAMVSTNDISNDAIDQLLDRVIQMAKIAPEDSFCGMAPEDLLAEQVMDLGLYDATPVTEEQLVDRAAAAEDAALAVSGVTNSEGAEASWSQGQFTLVTSQGFAAFNRSSRHSVSVSVIAETDQGKERDYEYSSTLFASDLQDSAEIGRQAGQRTVARLNPRKIGTEKLPVIFDPRVSSSLLRHLLGGISGAAIARGSSFLQQMLNKQVFAPNITILDNPLMIRGQRSQWFDAEGVAQQQRAVIDQGILTTWLLDSRSARQLGMITTGHAARGTSSAPSPSPTNFYMQPGQETPDQMIKSIKRGLYITEMMGQGVNMVTGDYSRGAGGFWIENGQIAYPVSEITIAGQLQDMFMHLHPASDLSFKYGVDAPTILIEQMMIAGQ